MLEIASLKKQVIYNLLQELDKVCTKLCAKKGESILRNKTYADMIQFEWNSLLREMSDRCPFLRDILVTVAKCANKSRNHIPPICLCYAILLQQRNRDLNLVQSINTVLLSEGNAKKQVGKVVRVHWRNVAMMHIPLSYFDRR